MRFPSLAIVCLYALVIVGPALTRREQPPAITRESIFREVRHELMMLPEYTVFDNISFEMRGRTVTLLGEVVKPSVKSEAENAVQHIEGVERVNNQIEILFSSSSDDSIRIAVFGAIYQYPGLRKYEFEVQKPIRIIVKNRNVTLDGVVDSEPDKSLAGIRARSVSGAASVTNNLQIAEPR